MTSVQRCTDVFMANVSSILHTQHTFILSYLCVCIFVQASVYCTGGFVTSFEDSRLRITTDYFSCIYIQRKGTLVYKCVPERRQCDVWSNVAALHGRLCNVVLKFVVSCEKQNQFFYLHLMTAQTFSVIPLLRIVGN